jgi:hypothetical protein
MYCTGNYCIGNHPSLFLQQVCSENSPQNCGVTTLGPVRPPHRFCRESLPIAAAIAHRRSVPNSPIGRNIQCEKGNF